MMTIYRIPILSSSMSILSSSTSIQSYFISRCDLQVIFHIHTVIYNIDTIISRSASISILFSSSISYCHLSVIFHVDTVIFTPCGQDDLIMSCHLGRRRLTKRWWQRRPTGRV